MLAPILVVALTAIVFLPVLDHEFVAWDDGGAFLDNPHYRGLSRTHLAWMWTTFHSGMYRPLTWMTYGADYLVWGMSPRGYHLTNLVLHLLNVLLVYLVARRLLAAGCPRPTAPLELEGRSSGAIALLAALAAGFFAVHPLRVEAVAWVSARADLLSTSFLLLSVLAYLASCNGMGRARRRRFYAGALACYGLSLLAKPLALGFPLVLLVLDVYPLRRLDLEGGAARSGQARSVYLEKLPFLVLASVMAPVVLLAKTTGSPVDIHGSHGLLAAASTVYALVFHLWKMLVPFGLSPLYEMPRFVVATGWRYALAAVVVVGLSALLIAKRRQWPGALAAWICYVVLLVPTSGIVPFGLQRAADRYTYLACLGWAFLAGAAGMSLRRRVAGRASYGALLPAAASVALVILAGYGVLTWRQNQIWRSSEGLWSYTVSVSPESMYAHSNLAFVHSSEGRMEEAAASLANAVRLDQGNPAFRLSLAHTLVVLGRYEEAIYHLEQAATVIDDKALAYNQIGAELLARGQLDQASDLFEKALTASPDRAEPHNNLGVVFLQRGKTNEAIEHFRRATNLFPGYVEAQNNLAGALLGTGQVDEALTLYARALELDEQSTLVRLNLADVLASQGRLDEAATHYRRVLEREPGNARAQTNLGAIVPPNHAEDVQASLMASGVEALYGKNDPARAAEVFRSVLALNATHYGATYQLASALERSGNEAESRALWKTVLEMAMTYRDDETAATARSRLAGR